MNELISKAAAESTCQKTVTVCVIYDDDDRVLACESNRCDPEGGTCHRLGTTSARAGYPATSDCNWFHAEQRAVAALAKKARPARAAIYGHMFVCEPCEIALRSAGVLLFEVFPLGHGTGRRA